MSRPLTFPGSIRAAACALLALALAGLLPPGAGAQDEHGFGYSLVSGALETLETGSEEDQRVALGLLRILLNSDPATSEGVEAALLELGVLQRLGRLADELDAAGPLLAAVEKRLDWEARAQAPRVEFDAAGPDEEEWTGAAPEGPSWLVLDARAGREYEIDTGYCATRWSVLADGSHEVLQSGYSYEGSTNLVRETAAGRLFVRLAPEGCIPDLRIVSAQAPRPLERAARSGAPAVETGLRYRGEVTDGEGSWLRVDAEAGRVYEAATLRLGAGFDSVVELYDGSEPPALLGENDDGGAEYRASAISWFVTEPATYYLRVKGYASSTGEFQVRVEDLGPPDEAGLLGIDVLPVATLAAEPAAAPSLFAGARQRVNGQGGWLQAQCAADGYLRVVTENADGPAIPIELAAFPAGAAPEGARPLARDYSTLTVPCESDGSVLLRITRTGDPTRSGSSTWMTATGETRESLASNGVPLDLAPLPAADSTGSIPLELGVTYRVVTGPEPTVARFACEPGKGHELLATRVSSAYRVGIAIETADGEELGRASSSSEGSEASALFACAGAPESRLLLASGTERGAYDLRLTRIDRSSGEPPEATEPIEPGTRLRGRVDEGELLWLRFPTEANKVYTIETSALSADMDSALALYDDLEGSEIASDDDGGAGLASKISRVAPADGTWRVSVRNYRGSAGSFDIEISEREPMPGELRDDPVILDVGTAITVEVPRCCDTIWYRFACSRGDLMRLATSDLPPQVDTVLELWDARDEVLAYDDDGGDGLASSIAWECRDTGPVTGTMRSISGGGPVSLSLTRTGEASQ